MAKIDIKIDTDQTEEIDIVDHHIEVDLSMNIIIENSHSMSKSTEEILGEEILVKHKTTEVKILEAEIEVDLGTVMLIEIRVGLEKDNFKVTLGETIEVVVSQDQDLEQVLIETELDVSNVGNMTTLPKIVQICQRQSKIKQNNCCTDARF